MSVQRSASVFGRGLVSSVMGLAAAAALTFVSTGASADAGAILSGYGGSAGYGAQVMTPNDDASSSLLNLPFGLNFYGTTYSNFYVNNNGNITFRAPVSEYTPSPFPIASQPMIAPFWGDVDTRCGTCGAVYVASPNENTVVVTWDRVGYYSTHSNLTNTFQLVLRNNAAQGDPVYAAGGFDIQFRYGQLQWTTGDASGGSGGFGGTPAQAGLDAGDRTNYFTLPGSRTAGVLNLANETNVPGGQAGLWTFAVRNGVPPGSTPDNPLMPVLNQGNWDFNFNIGPNTGRVFIDPLVAVGYDYVVNSGPLFQTVLLPTGVGDGLYDLWLWNGTGYYDSGFDIVGGQVYDFGANGVQRFSIRGIETSANLDPTNTFAFVTGLTFAGTGTVSMSMTPLTVDVGGGNIPLPGSLPLSALGLLLAYVGTRRAGRRVPPAATVH